MGSEYGFTLLYRIYSILRTALVIFSLIAVKFSINFLKLLLKKQERTRGGEI